MNLLRDKSSLIGNNILSSIEFSKGFVKYWINSVEANISFIYDYINNIVFFFLHFYLLILKDFYKT